MKTQFYFYIIFFAVIGTSHSYANNNCTNLIGSWYGEIYNEKKDYRHIFTDTFKKDGTFISEYNGTTLSGTNENTFIEVGESTESGTWTCDNGTFTMVTTMNSGTPQMPVEKIYNILELSDSYIKYQTIKGHSIALIYEAYKTYNE